jgi:putative aldouronate transport system substrate-binding protein
MRFVCGEPPPASSSSGAGRTGKEEERKVRPAIHRISDEKQGVIMKTYRVLLLGVVAALVLAPSSFAAGSQEQGATTGPPSEVRVAIWLSATGEETEEATYIDELILDQLNIKIVRNLVPMDLRLEKEAILVAGGELDVTRGPADFFYNAVIAGEATDLTGKLPSLAPNLYRFYKDYEALMGAQSFDGKIYGLAGPPSPLKQEWGVRTDPNAWDRLVIRTDWLEALDLDVPETIEDIYDVALAFKQNDVDGLGSNNVIPIIACNALDWNFHPFMGAFGVMKDQWYLDEDTGQVMNYNVHPNMKEFLEWTQRAYAAGLIDQDFITQKELNMKPKFANGQVGMYSQHWYPMTYGSFMALGDEWKLRKEGKLKGNDTYTLDPENGWVTWMQIDPPVGPHGDSGLPANGMNGGWRTWVPRNAKNVDAVLRLADFVSTKEGALLVQYGVEGTDFVLEPDGPEPGPAVADKDKWADYRKEKQMGAAGVFGGFYPLPLEYESLTAWHQRALQVTPYGPGGEFFSDFTLNGFDIANDKYVDFVRNNGLVAPSQSQYLARLKTIADEYFLRIVTGSYEIDKFDEFVERWYAEGGQTLVDEYTEVWKSRQ